MKKVLFSFLAVLFLAACEGPVGPPGRPGPQGPPGEGVVWDVLFFEVRNSGWTNTWAFSSTPDGDFFSTVIHIPELTPDVFDYGAVMVFLEWVDNGVLRQQPLPRSLPVRGLECFENEYGVEECWEVAWTEHFDFEYDENGFLQIFFTVSDFKYMDWHPGTRHFRVVLLW